MNFSESTERRTEWVLISIFAVLSLGIVAGGAFYYRNYEQQFRAQAEHQLSVIAELKAGELAQYRKERLEDASIFFNNSAFSGLVRRFFDHPEDANTQRQIQEWAVKLMATGQYDLVRLLDTQGVTRLSSPPKQPPVSSVVLQRMPEIFRSGQVTFEDFHRNEHDQRVYLDILIPIFDGQDGSRPLGIFYLRIDPEKYLYPFIQRWPVPSATAETLLARRDGNDALFLNELKFQTNTALNLRISLKNTNVAAVKAVLGQKGTVEGVDYRGVPVLAALGAIPNSPWFLVARMDTAEVFAPMMARLWQVVVMICVLLFGSGVSVALVWRQQRVRFYRAQSESAEALRKRVEELNCLYAIARLIEKEDKLEKILQGSADALPKGWAYPEIACARITFEEQQYKTGNFRATDWRLSADLKVNGQPVGVVELCYLKEQPTKDEGPFFKEERNLINAVAERLGGVAERKQAEEKLARLQQHAELIMSSAAEGIIGLDLQGNHTFVNPAAASMLGYEVEDLIGRPSHSTWHHTKFDGSPYPKEECLIYAAYRNGIKYRASDEVFWRSNGTSFPVEYASTPIYENGQLAGAVVTFTDITERKKAEEKLRQLFLAVEQSPASIVITNPDGDIEYVNPKFVSVTGYKLAEVLGKNPRILKSGEKGPEAYRKMWKTIMAGNEWRGEFHNKKKDGELYWESASISPIRNSAGFITHFVAVKEDITAQKQVEAERDQLIKDLKEALARVKSLSGLLPICAGCKKIRDDKGYWSQVESYIQEHSEAKFSHGLCPDCAKKYFPGLDENSPGKS